MGKYSEVMEQLFGAAKDRGLVPNSQIFALADGAKGLKEALENSFPGLQFIERSSSSQTTSLLSGSKQ